MNKRNLTGQVFYNAVLFEESIQIHEIIITEYNNLVIRAKVKMEDFEFDIEPTIFDLANYSNTKEEALEKLWQSELEKFDDSQSRWDLFCKHYNEVKS